MCYPQNGEHICSKSHQLNLLSSTEKEDQFRMEAPKEAQPTTTQQHILEERIHLVQ